MEQRILTCHMSSVSRGNVHSPYCNHVIDCSVQCATRTRHGVKAAAPPKRLIVAEETELYCIVLFSSGRL